MEMNKKLDYAKKFEELSPDGKEFLLLFRDTPSLDYDDYDGTNKEFGKLLRSMLKNQREMMQYKVQEWYLKLRDIKLEYDPLTDYDNFKKNEETFNEIIEQMGVWAGNEECLDKQYKKVKNNGRRA
ncbi:hypothetical protein LCGC14_1698580 [marine sediment metagenome]|uniref:Uncharacterized protein n=1 Tax=marine sediment metagenome TaxID=412755 RepID=A0A0F9JZ81_9ZZZZ